MSPNYTLSEFLFGFNSTIAVGAVIIMYVWIYYLRQYLEADKIKAVQKAPSASEHLAVGAAIDIQVMDNELLDATVLELQALIYDMWDEQDRRIACNT